MPTRKSAPDVDEIDYTYLIALVPIIATLLLGYREYRAHQAADLPMAPGVVRKCDVESFAKYHGVSLEYNFVVDNKTYRGYEHHQARNAELPDIVKRFAHQSEIVVHYNPSDPSESYVQGFSRVSGDITMLAYAGRMFVVVLPLIVAGLAYVFVVFWPRIADRLKAARM